MLEMDHIGKSFLGVRVLDDVRFDLVPGEVHVVAGENGAGKSTLMKILAGVHREYDGEILLDGHPIRFRSPQDATVHGIAVIYQELSLIRSMSVLDNLFLGREEGRGWFLHRRAEAGKALEIFRQLDLRIDLGRSVGEYPLAIQQMMEIAKALVCNARVIIMDEPTSALTEVEAVKLFQMIRILRSRGCAIVYISHKMEEIYDLADRITVLRDGKWIGTAETSQLPRDALIRWMVGREITQQFPERRTKPGDERLSLRSFCVPDPTGTRQWSVQNVNLSLRAGEIVGVAGLQGSGNSDLLMGLFGAFGRRVCGDVLLDGRPFDVSSPRRSIRQGLALLTNDRKEMGLVPDMSVCRNITLPSLRRFSRGGWMNRRTEKRAAEGHRMALAIRCASLDQPAHALSGGNQQKVILAKWIQTRPKVLLLDEPTRGVDVGAKQDIYEWMNRWTSEGIAILLITSEMSELLAMSDRMVVLHRGRIAGEFARAEASQNLILKSAMGEGDTVHGHVGT
jgi:ribose transport system ATP-binding protein